MTQPSPLGTISHKGRRLRCRAHCKRQTSGMSRHIGAIFGEKPAARPSAIPPASEYRNGARRSRTAAKTAQAVKNVINGSGRNR